MRRLLFVVLAPLVACGGASPSPAHPVASGANSQAPEDPARGVRTPELAALLRDSWELAMREDPIFATMLGDHRYDSEVRDLSPAAIGRRRAAERDQLARARAIESRVDPEDRVTYSLYLDIVESSIAMNVCDLEQWADSPMSNPVVGLNQLAMIHSVGSAEDARTYVARTRSFARLIDQDLANLQRGAQNGRVASRTTIERLISLVEHTLAQASSEWTVRAAALQGATALSENDRQSLERDLLTVIEADLRPAITRYHDGLVSDVLPHARDAQHEGVAALPQGEACYAATIRYNTSTARSAEELHALGEREIASTDARMLELGRRLFGVQTLQEVIDHLRSDTSLGYPSSEAILEDARARVAAGEEASTRFFAQRPQQTCKVLAVPPAEAEGAPFAYYIPGAPDGSRSGAFFVNAAAPETRRRHMLASLAAHEAVPGHHFQISIAQTLPEMPAFRRHGLFFTAYIEGWGLYSERLADEMGLYHDDLDRIGAVDLEAFRAARLVVDTGLHAFGWSRSQAEEYMRSHTSMAEDLVRIEVDRYINTPGQALAYKVGQLEILALRSAAEAALGSRFDLRAFHSLILEAGPLTMPVLRQLVQNWIAAQSESARE